MGVDSRHCVWGGVLGGGGTREEEVNGLAEIGVEGEENGAVEIVVGRPMKTDAPYGGRIFCRNGRLILD